MGETKEIIKWYLLAYGPTHKKDLRIHLQRVEKQKKKASNIKFKTNDAIDNHLKDLIDCGDIGLNETDDLYSLTEKAIQSLYVQLEKDQLKNELDDWDFHLQREREEKEIMKIVVKSLIELKENGYSKPF